MFAVVVVTGGEQSGNRGISDGVKREIKRFILDKLGMDKGIAVAGSKSYSEIKLFDFETCEGIQIWCNNVRCMECL